LEPLERAGLLKEEPSMTTNAIRNKPLLDKPAAALYTGFKERAIDHLIAKRLLEVVHIGRRVYIKQSELDQLMDKGTQK